MEAIAQRSELAEQASEPFVGRWIKLVSTTNWEKGKIIHQWRTALIEAGASQSDYSDEAWSRLVGGGISGQHVGRLRRVYERFNVVQHQFEGLFWSHFQAALDWDDAEMWLEGAVQNRWSVNQMRQRRAEVTGASDSPADSAPADASQADEDAGWPSDRRPERPRSKQSDASPSSGQWEWEPASPAGPDFGDEEPSTITGEIAEFRAAFDGAASAEGGDEPLVAPQPFSQIGELPDDLADALEAFKLAILRHKEAGWTQVSIAQVFAALDGLRLLTQSQPQLPA